MEHIEELEGNKKNVYTCEKNKWQFVKTTITYINSTVHKVGGGEENILKECLTKSYNYPLATEVRIYAQWKVKLM
jgi:hypothetical protein